MERICFTMLVAASAREAYVRAHEQTWPQLLTALDRTGWRNYSLFLRGDGLLVGYLESLDFAAAQAGMSATDVSARWSREMDKLVVPGSTLRYLRLENHSQSSQARAHRHCIVLSTPVDLDLQALAGADACPVSVFAGEGVTVIYAETIDQHGLDDTPLGTLAAETAPLVEVFNLAAQLDRLR